MKTAKRLAGIEYFRVAAAFLVVAIHCYPLLTYGDTADFILTRVAARTAVPFFFMVTGYFVVGSPERLRASLKKAGVMYLACILLYLPLNAYSGSMPDLRQLLFEGTFYHLWYFPAVMLGLIIAQAPIPHAGRAGYRCRAVPCRSAGRQLLGADKGPAKYFDCLWLYIWPYGYTRSGLFFAPIFLMLGAAMRKARRPGAAAASAGLVISLALMLCEALVLRHAGWQRHDSMYVFLPLVMYFLFTLLLVPGRTAPGWCADFSMLVYALHPWVIVLVRGAARPLGLWELMVENSLGHYLAVCAGTAAASAVLLILWQRIRPRAPYDKARAWVEVDAAALRQNAAQLRTVLPSGCELMPVLKCEAYGHGLVKSARLLSGCGVRAFAVACAAEGVELRRAGIKGTILVLGWTAPENFACLWRYRLTQTVTEPDYARRCPAADTASRYTSRSIPVCTALALTRLT